MAATRGSTVGQDDVQGQVCQGLRRDVDVVPVRVVALWWVRTMCYRRRGKAERGGVTLLCPNRLESQRAGAKAGGMHKCAGAWGDHLAWRACTLST